MRAVWLEVDDHQHAPGLEAGDEPLRGELGVVEVVEPEADHGKVEVEEYGVCEGPRVLVPRHAEVPVEGDHLVVSQSLQGNKEKTMGCQHVVFPDGSGGVWPRRLPRLRLFGRMHRAT